MDVYTTSFCLPYRTSYHELANRSPSFDFPRDVAGAATATGINHNSRHSASNSQSQASQQQQPQVQNQSQAPRHQVNRSLSSYSRPASIPEDREDGGTNGQNALGESTSSSSTGGSRFGGNGSRFGEGSNSQSGSASNVVGGANNATSTGLTARRSTSSIASLGQHTAPTTASSSIAGDNISTAPSSHIGHGVGGAFSNLNTGMTSILPAHHNNKIPSNTGSTGINHNHNHNHNSSEQIFNANTEGIIAIQRAQAELAESMQRLCMEAMANFQCMVTCSPIDDGTKSSTIPSTSSQQGTQVRNTSTLPSYNFILSGRYPQVMGARGYILRSSPYNRKAIVKVPRSEVLSSPSRSNRKESISSSNHNDGNGIINNGSSSNNNNNESYSGGNNNEQVKPEMKKKLDEIAALTRAHLAIVGQVSSNIGFGLELERSVEIVITGNYESVEQARVRLLVSLDELVSLLTD